MRTRNWEWLAIPNLGVLFVTLQALGFLMVLSDPAWFERLALIPAETLAGEVWRILTFLSLPVTTHPLWLVLALWFTYFILNSLESVWGSLRTTLYFLTGWLLTVVASLALGVPVASASDLVATFFLASAVLFPEFEILLFFVLPVKMKWLGLASGVFLLFRLAGEDWSGRIFVLAAYFNFVLFFGPRVLERLRNRARQRAFRRAFERSRLD